ncbi:MAG: hypothetical protein AB7I79_23440 [Rhizobiaceae bacterium]
MRGVKLFLIGLIGVFWVSSTTAADLPGSWSHAFCLASDAASDLSGYDDATLRTEVVRLMDEAVAAAASERWIVSKRPVFVWANEAKAACGKAYGYLQSSVRDADYLAKCACFHSRMTHYMH